MIGEEIAEASEVGNGMQLAIVKIQYGYNNGYNLREEFCTTGNVSFDCR